MLQVTIGPGTAQQREQFVLVILAGADLRHDLLRQHIKGFHRDVEAIQLTCPHRVEKRRALDELIAAQGKKPAPGHAANRVVGAAYPLEESGNRAWRGELAHQLHVADIDAEFQRCGGDECAQRTCLESLLRIQPLFA